ncbi:hypothetical protein BH11CYA1_BH11CYA1_19110 [soil metagenome]
MTFQILEQDMANAIGFVYDRTVSPPKFLAQGFLISKSRFVTTAGNVFHYPDAPWALSIYFPHADITMGVKTLSLHNDFDKVQARSQYLQQNGYPGEMLSVLPNDMALMVVDSTLPELQAEKVAELTRAMSIPFKKDGVESSGNIHGQEFLQVINTLLEQKRSGLLTLIDTHNIPVARLLLAEGTIPLVYYRQPELLPAYAFFELVIKQPAHGFTFEPEGNFPWPDAVPISAPADRLVWEGMRRANELNSVYGQLGGREARYQRVVQSYDPASSSEEIRWMVGRLWEAMDGFLTLENLAERVGSDSYTLLVAVRELVNRGVCSQINRKTPFHCNGTVGPPLTSHTDFEVNNWDNLQCFYLDPLSGKPIWLQGNYFGSASAAQPKNMLHTVVVPPDITGALVCKDYKLIGLHSGPQAVKSGQAAPPVKCYQFMWMGALLDMSSKKLRTAAEVEEEGGRGTLRSKLDAETATTLGPEIERIVCPVCFSSNAAYGACTSCGHIIEAPPPEIDTTSVKGKASKAVKVMQKKTGLTKKQLIIAGAVLVPLFLITIMMMPKPPAAVAPVAPGTVTVVPDAHPSSEKATALAVKSAGFKVLCLPDHWYEDTSALSKPNDSFGVYSERANQKIICTEFADLSPISNLSAFIGKPPYTEMTVTLQNCIADQGKQVLGEGILNWMVIKGKDKDDKDKTVLVASFPSLTAGKSFLVVGQALKSDTGNLSYDAKGAVSIIDQLATERTQQANNKNNDSDDEPDPDDENSKEATGVELKAFYAKVKEAIKEKLVLPDFAQDELKKEKSRRKKWKIRLTVGVDADGNVKRLEKQAVEDEDQDKINSALQRAVSAAAPFKDVPHIKKPELIFLVKLSGDKVKVEVPESDSGL